MTEFILTREYCKKFYPARKRNTDKTAYGSANLVAGSDKYIGAAALATQAALMSGCGFVKLTTTEKVKLALAARLPQTIFLDEPDLNSGAIAIGMGSGVSGELYNTIRKILIEYRGTLIIDADGLNILSRYGKQVLRSKNCSVVLTPHIREFSRLSGIPVEEISSNPQKYAEEFAGEYGVTVLLKGADSYICDGARTAVNTRGTTALAKGGSGDMLSGYICGSAARGLSPFDAACCAAFTMGLSAEISSAEKTDYCVTAKDLIKNIHKAVRQLAKTVDRLSDY